MTTWNTVRLFILFSFIWCFGFMGYNFFLVQIFDWNKPISLEDSHFLTTVWPIAGPLMASWMLFVAYLKRRRMVSRYPESVANPDRLDIPANTWNRLLQNPVLHLPNQTINLVPAGDGFKGRLRLNRFPRVGIPFVIKPFGKEEDRIVLGVQIVWGSPLRMYSGSDIKLHHLLKEGLQSV